MNLRSILSGSVYLILLQFVSRITTFVLNQLLLPHITAEVVGIAMIQMDFLVNTILFFSREGIRNALFRSSHSDPLEKQKLLVNISWLASVCGIPVTIGMVGYFLIFASDVEHYHSCVYIFGFSTWLELLIEPMFAVTQANLNFKVRVFIEGLAVVLNVFTCYCFVKLGDSGDPANNSYGVLAFAYARLSFSLGLIFGYGLVYGFNRQLRTFKLNALKSNKYVDTKTLALAWSFTKQSLVKQLLNEGDKFIMSMLASPAVQGIWAIVLNYGSLIARIVFAPLEEIFRVSYSKLLLDARTRSTEPEIRTNINTSHKLMLLSLRLHSILGLIFICFGSYFAYPILHMIIGEEWANKAAPTLSWFCYLVPLMGYNGVLESFVSSVASEAELQIQSTWMMIFMTIYSLTAYTTLSIVQMGTIGIIIANAVNFTCRILWCTLFVKKYYHDLGLYNLLLNRCFPELITMIVGLTTMYYISTDFSIYFDNPSREQSILFLKGHVITGVAFVGVLMVSERVVLKDLKSLLAKEKQKAS